MNFEVDKLIFSPDDVDLRYSPLRKSLDAETYVLGAFNPGLTRLPGGNLLIMVRVAEALKNPAIGDKIHAIGWGPEGYRLEAFPLDEVITDDPRKFILKKYLPTLVYALTSLSWLLPVELSPDGLEVINIHYDKIISPDRTSQEYGIEDARISFIDGKYYMTTCTVSSERHATTLFSSDNGLDYHFEGIVLDHQNKDMLIFEAKIGNMYYAMTRPLGMLYFDTGDKSEYYAGPSINLAVSPDLLHWKPTDHPFIRSGKDSGFTNRIGGGTPPILTSRGWLELFHGVETSGEVGIYRTYWALLDQDDPNRVIFMEDKVPLLEFQAELTADIKDQIYLHNVVFTTGIIDAGDYFIVASGELDLACRITHIPKSYFGL